jgi:hypothetical protein
MVSELGSESEMYGRVESGQRGNNQNFDLDNNWLLTIVRK